MFLSLFRGILLMIRNINVISAAIINVCVRVTVFLTYDDIVLMLDYVCVMCCFRVPFFSSLGMPWNTSFLLA
jgi:hypothetical protein